MLRPQYFLPNIPKVPAGASGMVYRIEQANEIGLMTLDT